MLILSMINQTKRHLKTIENAQYRAQYIAVTGVIQEMSRELLYSEL